MIDQANPHQCPSCHFPDGRLVRVGVGTTSNTLTFVCPACLWKWRIVKPAEPWAAPIVVRGDVRSK